MAHSSCDLVKFLILLMPQLPHLYNLNTSILIVELL